MKVFLVLVLVIGAGLLFFSLFAVRVAGPVATPAMVVTSPVGPNNPNVVADPANQLWQLTRRIAETSSANSSAIARLEGRIVALQGRQAALATQTKEMVNLRFTLEHAMTQGDESGKWPVRAASRWWERPALQTAVRRVNAYVRDQEAMDGRIGEALAKLDRSMSALREQAGRLRDADTSLTYSQRNFSMGGGISTAELNSVRGIVDRANQVINDATRDLPNAALFMLPGFDLDPPRE